MAQQGRGAGLHPEEPPAKRRTLQIKLGRPRPTTEFEPTEQASPSLNRSRPASSLGIRISLKKKPSFAESQSTPPRLSALSGDDTGDIEEEDDDQDDQRLDAGVASGQNEDDNDDGDEDDDGQDEDDEEQDGDEGEDMEGDDIDDQRVGEAEIESNGNAVGTGNEASSTRIRGKDGTFKTVNGSASSSHPSRRPIKRLRSKGLYEALPKLIENLQRRDSYKFFCEPVNPDDVPGYSDVIKTPMDFGTMQRKVDDRLYSHIDEFKSDFHLVVNNAQTFNPEGTLYYNEAKRIGAWGARAIEREGMAVNDNGRAGVKGDEIRRQKRLEREAAVSTSAVGVDASIGEGSGRRQLRGATLPQQQALDEGNLHKGNDGQASIGYGAATGEVSTRARGSQIAFSAGVEAIMEAARVTSYARQRAAIALGLAGGTLTREDSVQPRDIKAEGEADMDIDDDDMDGSDEEGGGRASVAWGRESRERSVTVDGFSRRLGSSLPADTPSTPMGQRQPSPDALRKRLAAVTGTPIQALASPFGPNATGGGTSRAKHVKQKQRLGAPGTPKRLLARTDNTGPATPSAGPGNASGLPMPAAAAAAAAAQLMSNLSHTQLQPGIANYSFDDDGSINPDDIDDLQTFLTLHRSGRHVLMPTIESLHPIPFVPGDYAGGGAADKEKDADKDKERSKEKEAAKNKGAAAEDGDDDDEDGKGEGREKGDKDTLPSLRPGAPDPLYSAIAPEPESLLGNLSHDVEQLPPHFRNLPFFTPSLPGQAIKDEDVPSMPKSWSNPAYVEALKNDKKPKKQKDKEREKERETLEDWSYFRPALSRLLEVTDLGPYSALVPRIDDGVSKVAPRSKGGKSANVTATQSCEFSTTLLGEEGIAALKEELEHARKGRLLPNDILSRYVQAARNGNAAATNLAFSGEERQDASRILANMVYGGVMGNAYIRSIGEFVGGAMHHAMLLDEADDADEQRIAEAESWFARVAALREAKETEETPEPTAASRRGPFMWRDATEEVVDGTDTPEHDQTAHTTARATPAAEHEEAQLTVLENVVVKQLEPMPKPLAQVVEEEIIRPITGNTLDVLHLVAALNKTPGAEALDAVEIEARLLKNKFTPHSVDGDKDVSTKGNQQEQLMTPPPPQQPPQQKAALPPVPFSEELQWLKDQPGLTQLLDEARNDVDSLGSIVNYIVQSA